MCRLLSVCVLLAALAVHYSDAAALKDLGYPDFSCDPAVFGRSKSVPTSVHALRWADIDIVAALGDSLTAGNGAAARPGDPLAIAVQNRGLVFSAGGDKGLEQHITVPNIMKKFNPELFGYSTGSSTENIWNRARLNAAIPGAHSGALVNQAHDLVQRMKDHPETVDLNNHWKLVTIFIGGNDICAFCYHQESEAPPKFGDDVRQTIQILKDNLPRTIVSLMGMFDMTMLRTIDHNQYFCDTLHDLECKCEQNASVSNEAMSKQCHAYMAVEQTLQDSGMFDTTDDFTLVIQPYWNSITTPPLMPDGKPDLSFFAPDCFHFSQYGHAVVAKNLWNNMVEPVGGKSTMGNLTDLNNALHCPDPACPFIRTTKNSVDCSKYMNLNRS